MNLDDYPRTAEEAKALKLKFFYSGTRCKHGHDALRYSHGGRNCVTCNINRARLRNTEVRDARNAMPVRPLVLLGADWSVRVAGGTLDDVWRIAVALKEQRVEE
jgi:hypothetical protein